MYRSDITIIGAGVIGLGIAAQVANKSRGVYVLEKNETFGQETSSRNSEVIHAGIYYPQGSLKAKFCVEGNAMLYELCQKYGIGHKRLEKVMVAVNDADAEELEMLFHRGRDNGARDLRMLSQRELRELEPNVSGVAAILSPTTGIVDSHALMEYFITQAKENGAEIVYKSKVVAIEKVAEGYKVTIEGDAEIFSFITKVVINCAGLNSDKIAEMAGIDIVEAGYKLHYCKGEYFNVGHGKGKLVKRLIYPVPPQGEDVGIHVTLDLEGRMRLGPNSCYVNEVNYAVDASQKQAFYDAAIKFLPFMEYDDLEPEMAGIRPDLEGPGGDFRDFVLRHEHDRGLPGLINLVGIESPGLTSAPAIAKYVANMVAEIL
jgi:L-2-hydroxyglutarate oxidase LhgO